MDLKWRISTDFGPKWHQNSENRAKIKNVKCTSFSPLFYLGMTRKAEFSDLNRRKYHILYSSNVKKSLIFTTSPRPQPRLDPWCWSFMRQSLWNSLRFNIMISFSLRDSVRQHFYPPASIFHSAYNTLYPIFLKIMLSIYPIIYIALL